MPCRRTSAAPFSLAALLLACQQQGASAQESAWTVAVSSARSERGLAYLDKPLAEASWNWWSARGWSVGATAAKALHGPQAALSTSAGYSWPLASGVDAYVALSHSDYRREGDWRYRHNNVRVTVNVGDRLFASLSSLYDARSRSSYGSLPVARALARELVWRQPLPSGLTLVAGAGHASDRGPSNFSYLYGNLGLRAAVRDATFEASWITTDSGARRYWGSRAGNRWVASLRWDM